MKINNKILSIPPYISTSWSYVDGIYMKGATLVITLFGGESVNIPGLKPDIIESIFSAHAESLEQEATQPSLNKSETSQIQGLPFGLPIFSQALPLMGNSENAFQLGISSMDGFGTALQHNPSQADAPDMPVEILHKIAAIIKIIAPDDIFAGASPVSDCNCPHCQITRAVKEEEDYEFFDEKEPLFVENEVPTPSRWMIQQTGENLYTVVDNEDASKTEYKVFLGQPVGCTCGKEGCEHIVAVLKS